LQRYLEVGAHTAQSLWLGIRIERELGDRDALASYSLQLEKSYPDSEEARLLLESKGS
jgi:type IV pilus assembly protein PilF